MADIWQKDSWVRLAGLILGLAVCFYVFLTALSTMPWGEVVFWGTLAFFLRLRPVPLLKDAKGAILLSHVPGESVLLIMILRHGPEAAALVSLLTNLLAFGRIWRSWLIVPSAVLGSLSTIVWLPFLAFVCGWIYQRLQGISILKPSDCEVLFDNPRAVLLPLLAGICVSYELLNRVYMSLGLWLKRGVRFESLLFDWDAGVFEHVENMGAVLALAMWTTWGVGVLPYIILVMEALLLAARERVQRQEARKEATSDPLTGLASARGLSEAIQRRLKAAKPFALLYLDMDGFKQVNDRYGHAVGDCLLIQVAEILKSNGASADLVGRRGGDEFVIVLAEQDRAGAEQVRTQLRRAIAIALQNDPRFASVNFSGGIALYPNDGLSEGALLDAADQAMYAEKQLRRRAAA